MSGGAGFGVSGFGLGRPSRGSYWILCSSEGLCKGY